jgi:hypothetical protein
MKLPRRSSPTTGRLALEPRPDKREARLLRRINRHRRKIRRYARRLPK